VRAQEPRLRGDGLSDLEKGLALVHAQVRVELRRADEKRNPFLAQETIIAEAGGPTGAWKSMAVDLAAEFRSHFAPDDPDAKLPDFGGIGIMSDGDQTRSASEADFGDFEIDYLGTGKDGPGPGGPGG